MTDPTPFPTAQMASPTYRIAALDQDFILSDSQRGLRLQLEYEKAEEALRNWGVRSTVVIFGSARIREDGPPKDQYRYGEARRLARIISEHDGALSPKNGVRDNVIATGGGPGIMEAANRGAYDAGAPTIGLNITLPHEQQPNSYTTPELTFQFHYFSMRKMHLVMRANALVVFPGGFGTFDESFEILTLVQTGKMPPVPIIFFEEAYWRKIINFDALVEEGVIAAKDLALIDFVDTADAAWEIIHRKQRIKS